MTISSFDLPTGPNGVIGAAYKNAVGNPTNERYGIGLVKPAGGKEPDYKWSDVAKGRDKSMPNPNSTMGG